MLSRQLSGVQTHECCAAEPALEAGSTPVHTRVISGARSLGSSSVLSDVRGGARLDVLSHEPVAGSSLLVLLDAWMVKAKEIGDFGTGCRKHHG